MHSGKKQTSLFPYFNKFSGKKKIDSKLDPGMGKITPSRMP